MSRISADLIPFESFLRPLLNLFRKTRHTDGEVDSGMDSRRNHRPRVAGGGENLPLEVIRCLSEWLSVLEDRGNVSGESTALRCPPVCCRAH